MFDARESRSPADLYAMCEHAHAKGLIHPFSTIATSPRLLVRQRRLPGAIKSGPHAGADAYLVTVCTGAGMDTFALAEILPPSVERDTAAMLLEVKRANARAAPGAFLIAPDKVTLLYVDSTFPVILRRYLFAARMLFGINLANPRNYEDMPYGKTPCPPPHRWEVYPPARLAYDPLSRTYSFDLEASHTLPRPPSAPMYDPTPPARSGIRGAAAAFDASPDLRDSIASHGVL